MNSLLNTYTGSVLICQGVLDPLNDASNRADVFASLRPGISVDKLQLGHCPMDENATMVSKMNLSICVYMNICAYVYMCICIYVII